MNPHRLIAASILPFTRTAILAVILSFTQMSDVSAGVINGDFTTPGAGADPFDGWSSRSPFVSAIDGGGVARFDTTNRTDPIVQLEQTFTVPIDATTLSFELGFTSTAGGVSGGSSAFDSFQATLFDSSMSPLHSIGLFFPAYYSIDASGFESTSSSGVTVTSIAPNFKRIILDVSGLALQDVTLDFALLGDDDLFTTTALVDNVVLNQSSSVIPEPGQIVYWTLFATALTVRRRRRRK